MLRFAVPIFVTVLLAAGCTPMPAPKSDEPPPPPNLAEPQTTPPDLHTIQLIDSSNPEVQALLTARADTLNDQQRIERNVIINASERAKDGDWAGAVNTYETALKTYPSSMLLRNGLARAYTGREQTASGLETQLLLSRGEWLAGSLPLYEQLASLEPSAISAKLKLSIWSSEARKVARDLQERGKRALLEADLKTAERTLQLASQLSPEVDVSADLAQIDQQRLQQAQQKKRVNVAAEQLRKQEEDKRKEEQQRKRKAEVAAIHDALNQAVNNNNLAESKKLLAQLESYTGETQTTNDIRAKLNRNIAVEVQRLLDQGIQYYSKNEFEKALVTWRAALALEPNNQQVITNIERAERVVDSFKKLKDRQE